MEYKACWIAYFDILGFKSEVRAFHVATIMEYYRRAIDRIPHNGGPVEGRWFSDTFLLYTRDDSESSFKRIRLVCESFFYGMITGGIPFRGCLTVGDMHIDEKQGVLVGPALIEACETAEGQDWLGFILTEVAADRIRQYDAKGQSLHDWLAEHAYRYYDVPFKEKVLGRPRPAKRRKLLTFTLDPLSWERSDALEHACSLYERLEDMQHRAMVVLEQGEQKKRAEGRQSRADLQKGQRERIRIRRKYTETKRFLLNVVPALREHVRLEDRAL